MIFLTYDECARIHLHCNLRTTCTFLFLLYCLVCFSFFPSSEVPLGLWMVLYEYSILLLFSNYKFHGSCFDPKLKLLSGWSFACLGFLWVLQFPHTAQDRINCISLVIDWLPFQSVLLSYSQCSWDIHWRCYWRWVNERFL